MEQIDPRNVAVDHVGVLEPEHQTERLVLLRLGDIRVAPDD
jgi:hypothetical protein